MLAPRLIGVAGTTVTVGPEATATEATPGLAGPRLFWGALVLAVVALLLLVARLLRDGAG